MPNDSQKVEASEDELNLPLDAETDDSSDDDVEVTEPDLSSLRKAFDDVKAQTATRAELEALKRQAGHVPALQRELAELKAQIQLQDKMQARLDAYETMLLDVLPTDSAERVEAQRQARTQEELLDEKLKPLIEKFAREDEPPEEADNSYAVAELQARIDAATSFVKAEATKKGIDPDSIPPEVWANAQVKHGLDLEQASLEVLKYVNEQAAKRSASDRRSEKKAAAEGGNSPERAGSMGQYDLTTLKGAAQARKDNAITSEQFMEVYQRVSSGR